MEEIVEEKISPELSKLGNYALRVGEDLYTRINKYIHVVKSLEDKKITKQNWIREAVKEKLEKEKDVSPGSISRERVLTFKLEYPLIKAIEGQVEITKKFRYSYSKKKWFEEAFYEKLERDEHKAKTLLEKLVESQKSKV
ncbi:conserved hypothetical protein (plasmid) [Candidatus Protochlamydia naegleriophila]|uniref:Uncharacterized protein n=1 Tax=Candidatus Protochlamydia naegleriophila TaxID=389348 RepID=A0A0U5EUZ3_9BACT|nr:hypothetical protein [Candidatus Protochlamydia naegleriophila]CUI18083.1 conserved hypothetical protein [Candidatus Protochlamydia naegleriophila]